MRDYYFLRLSTHNGILRTFLQHTKIQPKGEIIKKIESLQESKEIEVQFQSLDPDEIAGILATRATNSAASRKKQQAQFDEHSTTNQPKEKTSGVETIKPLMELNNDKTKLFNRKGDLSDKRIELSGWVMPGVAPRYENEPAWLGPARTALLLMLAPITCIYEHLKGEGDNWITVVPDVRDLSEFDNVRPSLGLDPTFLDVASLGDAGLRFAMEYSARSARKNLPVGCLVVAMGQVNYYAKQRIRKGVLEVTAPPLSIRRYAHLHRALPNRQVLIRSGIESEVRPPQIAGNLRDTRQRVFYVTPAGRGRIADNLLRERPWYADLFTPFALDLDSLEKSRKRNPGSSIEWLWFEELSYQKGLLMELIQENDMWESDDERNFVFAFWEALGSLYAQESKAVERGGSRTFDDRFKDRNAKIFRQLTRAKTRDLLRGSLAELFAEAGRQQTLRRHPASIWNLIDHAYNWKRARDLALLALATYQSKEKREGMIDSSSEARGGQP